MSDDERISLAACALPGTVSVTLAAMKLAERFQSAIPSGWIVAFSWHDGEKIRASRDASWIDRGPGLGLGAYRNTQIPDEAVVTVEMLRYVVLIRQDILDAHPDRVVDLAEGGRIILR